MSVNETIKNILLSQKENDQQLILDYINFLNQCNDKEDIQYHHILPKSLFPAFEKNKDNLIPLSPYHHFLAHKILKDIFPTPEMNLAYAFMVRLLKENPLITEEDYNQSIILANQSISEKLKGKEKSELHKQHISQSRMGMSYGPLSEKHKKKISDSMKGKNPSELNRKINSERMKQRVGEKNSQSKKILCVEDNLIFDTVKQCCDYYHISNLHRYTQTGKIHTKLQKHFCYMEET